MVPYNYHLICPALQKSRFAIKNGKVLLTKSEDDVA